MSTLSDTAVTVTTVTSVLSVLVGLGADASTQTVTSTYATIVSNDAALTTATITSNLVVGLGLDASTKTSVITVTVSNPAEYSSLRSAEASTPASSTGSGAAASVLSLGAKVAIGVTIPLLIVLAALVAIYCYRRRRRQQTPQHSGSDIYTVLDGKPELYAGPADPTIAGPVRSKPELPTNKAAPLPPELHGIMIMEADANTKGQLLAKPWTSDSYGGLEKPQTLASSQTDMAIHTANSELVEEADAAVQELGLISMRKKTLVAHANASGKRPEEAEGRKAEEYAELLQREERVRKRLGEIETERRTLHGKTGLQD